MRLWWLIVFFVCNAPAFSQQFPFENWHEGKVVLETGDTLTGNVKYNLQSDLVQFERDSKLESFTARKVLFFEIFDTSVKRYRSFYSLPYTTSGEYRAPVFFELLAEGKMTLLCREALEYRSYPSTFYYYGSTSRVVLVNKYFLLKEDGTIEPFNGKRSDLTYLMGRFADEVESFAKSNKLNIDDKYEFAKIVSYYNSLFM